MTTPIDSARTYGMPRWLITSMSWVLDTTSRIIGLDALVRWMERREQR